MKKKPVKPEQKMYGYGIKIHQHQDHYEHDGEQYGSWSAEYSNTLDNKITRDDKYPDVTAPFELQNGEAALVVWVIWSSGDSFGHGVGSGSEVIGIFKDLKSAKHLHDYINEHARGDRQGNGTKDYGYNIQTPDGQVFKSGFAPWSGYFESLDSVNIDTVACW